MGRNGKGKKRKRESRREEVMGRKRERKGGKCCVMAVGGWTPLHTHTQRERETDRQTDRRR